MIFMKIDDVKSENLLSLYTSRNKLISLQDSYLIAYIYDELYGSWTNR